MNRKVLILFVLLLALIVSVCGSQEKAEKDTAPTENKISTEVPVASDPTPDVHISVEKDFLTVDELSEIYPFVVYGTVLSTKGIEGNLGYSFTVKILETLQGKMEEQVIDVCSYDGVFKEGMNYILFLEPMESVFLDKSYYGCGEELFFRDKEFVGSKILKTTPADEKSLLEEVRQTIAAHPFTGEIVVGGTPFFKTKDVRELYELSSHAMKAQVVSIELDNPQNTVVACHVVQYLKGEGSENILISLKKDGVQVGETYYFLLRRVEDSDLFVINSSVSVVSPDSEEGKFLAGKE